MKSLINSSPIKGRNTLANRIGKRWEGFISNPRLITWVCRTALVVIFLFAFVFSVRGHQFNPKGLSWVNAQYYHNLYHQKIERQLGIKMDN
jgi:hypothetical protein